MLASSVRNHLKITYETVRRNVYHLSTTEGLQRGVEEV